MSVIGTLAVNIVARTEKFTGPLAKAGGSMRLFSKATAGVAAVVGTTVTALTRLGMTYERLNRSMTESLAIMGNVSAAMRDKMTKAAIEASRTTRFSAAEVARGYYFLSAAGLDAQQSLAALPQVSKFAAAGNFDLALATDLATDAQSALGMTVKDSAQNLTNLTRVTDVLIKANTIANASAQQFSESLTNKAGAAMRIVGMEIEEGVAVLAAYADQGIKGAEAGTAFGIVLRDLQTKALLNAGAFREMGIAVYDAQGEFRRFPEILADIERRLDGMSDAQSKATLMALGFSDKSVAYLQSLIGLSSKIENYEAKLRSAAGMTDEVANNQMTNLERALAKLGAAWETLSLHMGPAIDELASAITLMTDLTASTEGASGPLLFLADSMYKLRISTLGALVALREFYAWNQKFIGISDEEMDKFRAETQKLRWDMFGILKEGLPSERGKNALAESAEEAGEALNEALGPKRSFLDRWRGSANSLVDIMKGAAGDLEKMQLDQALHDLTFGAMGKNYRMGAAKSPAGAMSQGRGTLAFAQSGSAESYRQQAAIRRQNEPMLKIGQQQLAEQKKMREGIDKLAAKGGAAPANL